MDAFDIERVDFDPERFSGVVRMFPIPNLVMFPHVVQPLHIFEGRYRELMEDALAGDQLIAMPVLKSGWEPDYEGRPPVEPWACLGKVVLHNKLPDGCFNLLLMGVARLRIECELDPIRSFRQARAEIVADVCPCADSSEPLQLRRHLVAAFESCADECDSARALKKLINSDLPLGQLADLIAYAVPLGGKEKLALLSEPCVVDRARSLLDLLGGDATATVSQVGVGKFPPPFSAN